MAFRYSPRIVNDGLVFNIDAKNPTSVPPSDGTRSATFNGSTQYLSSDSVDFNITDVISFGGWIYFNSINENVLISKWGTGYPNTSYLIFMDSSDKFRLLASSDGASLTNVLSTTVATTGQWYFVVGVYDGTDLKLSIDGGSFDSLPHAGGIHVSSVDLMIGQYGNYGTTFHNGKIDNAFIYNKALTLTEIQTLYNSGNGVSYNDLTTSQKVDLVSWWSLNETKDDRHDSHGTNDLLDNGTVGFDTGKVTESEWALSQITKNTIRKSEEGDGTNGVFVRDGVWEFDGINDYIVFSKHLYGLTEFSVDFWWYYDSSISTNSTIIAENFSSDTGFWVLYRYNGANNIRFQFGDGTTNSFFNSLLSLSQLNDNTWYNLTFTTKNKVGNIYVNGTFNSSYTNTNNISWNLDDNLTIGKRSSGSGYYGDIKVSNVKIYNRALTASEISQNYNTLKGRFGL
jgi:hypothetical protein